MSPLNREPEKPDASATASGTDVTVSSTGAAGFSGLQTLRPGSSIALGSAGLLAGLAIVVPALLSSQRPWGLIAGVVLAMVVLWLYLVRPHVKVHDEGVRIVNPLQTIDLTWPTITEVRSRWSLELLSGPKKYTAWGVPADMSRPRSGLIGLGAGKFRGGDQPEAKRPRPKIEARAVAAEIESRIAADRARPEGETPRIIQRVWDPVPVGLLLGSIAFFALAVLL